MGASVVGASGVLLATVVVEGGEGVAGRVVVGATVVTNAAVLGGAMEGEWEEEVCGGVCAVGEPEVRLSPGRGFGKSVDIPIAG